LIHQASAIINHPAVPFSTTPHIVGLFICDYFMLVIRKPDLIFFALIVELEFVKFSYYNDFAVGQQRSVL